MIKCGVEKYDKLPAKVGTFDVDALRLRYREALKRKKYFEMMLENASERAEELAILAKARQRKKQKRS